MNASEPTENVGVAGWLAFRHHDASARLAA